MTLASWTVVGSAIEDLDPVCAEQLGG